uniref:Bm10920 n=1 Tax=Brugia malayi TaxID=6279 RepID=A0A1I9G4N8_BRUMA|nr:Bm10920 [Brugia malayi]
MSGRAWAIIDWGPTTYVVRTRVRDSTIDPTARAVGCGVNYTRTHTHRAQMRSCDVCARAA